MELALILGLFNIFVGLMLVASFLLMGGGFIAWFVRLGTNLTYRDEAIMYMKWGVTIMFVLVVLLAFVKFVQEHTAGAMFLLGIVVVLAVIWLVLKVATAPKEEEGGH